MSTTNDELDGWHEVALGHLPEPTKNVALWSLSHGCVTGSWDGVSWRLAYGLKSKLSEGNVTHWRELPEPPKTKDAFETWWEGLRVNKHYPPNMARFVGVPEQQDTIMKHHANVIWEAAINSTKQ